MQADKLITTKNLKPTDITLSLEKQAFKFPAGIALFTLALCLLPLLYQLNIDFSFASRYEPFNIEQVALWQLSRAHLIDEMFYVLAGGIQHALLEWSAVVLAFLCVFVSLAHYSMSKDATAPIIGLALLMSGAMDLFHTLAATRLLDAVAENSNLIPFTWAVSRSFSASVLLIGVLLLLINKKQQLNIRMPQIISATVVLFIIAYLLSSWMALSESLPQTQFPGSFITRPYDALPMIIFIICIPFYWRWLKKSPSFLAAMMLIGLMPDVFSEAYMAFGSDTLFDHHFNSSHGLKILSYALPFLGYLLDYQQMYLQKKQQEMKLGSMNQALQKAERRYRTINHLMPVAILLVNQRGNIVEANQQASDLFGYSLDELDDMAVDQLVPEASRNAHVAMRESFNQNQSMRKMAAKAKSLTGQSKSGKHIPVEVGLAPIELHDETYIVVSIMDVSQRQHMLDLLKEKNIQMDQAIEKLSHSNEQLERFAYVCSHDLQEPVRMVLSFSQLLEKRLGDELDDKNREYLHYITDGAIRAREMISDILTFCRLDQNTDAFETVALSNICEQVHSTLQQLIEEKQAEFHWDSDLPELNAVPSQLFQLVMNLVNNGLKFNRSDTPRVSVHVTDEKDHLRIEFTDNGIGIDARYKDKLFQIFERLNAKSEFPGTGIGLAVCKKVAENHGASLQIESEPDRGSTFVLNWPI